MSSHLNQYLIFLSIKGIRYKDNPKALEQITNELAMRAHLQCNSIVQKDTGEFNEIIVEVVSWGLTKESTAKQVAEELFEIACAVLERPEGVSIHIESIVHCDLKNE